MRNVEGLSDRELEELARVWRKRALEGELHARGTAHLLETEARRRVGLARFDPEALDLRTLADRQFLPHQGLGARLLKAGMLAAGLTLVLLLLVAYR